MLARIALVAAALLAAPDVATADIAIHATSVGELAKDPSHVRTMRGALARGLADVPDGYTLDVSLVRLRTTTVGSEIEVHAEIRAALSDRQGAMRWTSASRAVARGPKRDRASLHRDAISGAAENLARQVRARCRDDRTASR